MAARGPATDAATGERVGRFLWNCTVERALDRHDHGLAVCDAIVELAEGIIAMRGLDPQGESEAPFAVTGGSGAYSAARGDGLWTDIETDDGWVTDVVIHLVD